MPIVIKRREFETCEIDTSTALRDLMSVGGRVSVPWSRHLAQFVVELRVYSDQSLGWDCVEDLQGGCCPCEICNRCVCHRRVRRPGAV